VERDCADGNLTCLIAPGRATPERQSVSRIREDVFTSVVRAYDSHTLINHGVRYLPSADSSCSKNRSHG
jgi:hypothetical protein